jgi:magnesium-transporting ATPase (P-type)
VLPKKIKKINLEKINAMIRNSGKKKAIIIDGKTLALILGNEELEKNFFKLGLCASSVICCRVSPA